MRIYLHAAALYAREDGIKLVDVLQRSDLDSAEIGCAAGDTRHAFRQLRKDHLLRKQPFLHLRVYGPCQVVPLEKGGEDGIITCCSMNSIKSLVDIPSSSSISSSGSVKGWLVTDERKRDVPSESSAGEELLFLWWRSLG